MYVLSGLGQYLISSYLCPPDLRVLVIMSIHRLSFQPQANGDICTSYEVTGQV